MAKVSIKDLDLKGKRVFIRVDFNVPLKDGRIGDDTRLRGSVPTIQHALDAGATAVLASHLGRPKGKRNPQFSLQPVVEPLAELLGRPVTFADDSIGDEVKRTIDRVHAPGGGGVVLIENLRFHEEEEKNEPGFAAALAALADEYVNDAFGAAHRAHASVEAITRHFPRAAAGLLMEKELRYLGHALESPDRPFVAILGGAKVSDKIEVIENLLGRVNRLLIGGAMAYTFFKSRGVATGDRSSKTTSSTRRDQSRPMPGHETSASSCPSITSWPIASTPALRTKCSTWATRGSATVSGWTSARRLSGITRRLLADAKTVIWNGPMGVFEIPAFAIGTNAVARAVANVKGTTIVGGGDSISALRKAGMADRVTHISTGGGASLEFLGGRTLPGVAALTDA